MPIICLDCLHTASQADNFCSQCGENLKEREELPMPSLMRIDRTDGTVTLSGPQCSWVITTNKAYIDEITPYAIAYEQLAAFREEKFYEVIARITANDKKRSAAV